MISVAMKPGTDRVGPHIEVAVFISGASHQLLDRCLARPVSTEERMDEPAGDRRHADERSMPGLDQMRQRVLQAKKGADRVEVQHPDEFGGVLLGDGGEPAAAARVGDAAREPTGGVRGEGNRLRDRGFLGDVSNDLADRAGAFFADPGFALDALDGFRQLRLGAPADRDVGAVSHEARGTGPADTGSAAGDQHGVRGEVCSL
jgi:hypothetical protein